MSNSKYKHDLTGQRFGRLTVIERYTKIKDPNEHFWLCKCDCGTETIMRQTPLLRGTSKSCGCLRAEHMSKVAYKHGNAGTPLYTTYHSILKIVKHHQEKGHYYINICDDWQTYEGFKEWALSHGWVHGKWIVRKDRFKGYNPDNCEVVEAKWDETKKKGN